MNNLRSDTLYYAKDLTKEELRKCVYLAEGIVAFPRETRFGPIIDIKIDYLFTFSKIRFFTKGYHNYNSLGLTTQVPAMTNFIVDKKIKILDSYWKKIYKIEVEDSEVFDKFSYFEYIIFDSLVNLENTGDGYFHNDADKVVHLFEKMDRFNSQGVKVDKRKVAQAALDESPALVKYKHLFTF